MKARRKYYRGFAPQRARSCWYHLVQRCTNPNDKSYKYYGGKGVKVEWADFASFWEDMGATYWEEGEIDRIDSEGNYCKENCRWVSRLEQMSNTSRNVFITHQNKTQTLSQWARDLGISVQTLASRLNKSRMSPNEAFQKRHSYRRLTEINGVRKSLDEWESESGVNRHTISWRLRHGWAHDKVLKRKI